MSFSEELDPALLFFTHVGFPAMLPKRVKNEQGDSIGADNLPLLGSCLLIWVKEVCDPLMILLYSAKNKYFLPMTTYLMFSYWVSTSNIKCKAAYRGE